MAVALLTTYPDFLRRLRSVYTGIDEEE